MSEIVIRQRIAEIRARLDAYKHAYKWQFEKGTDLWPIVDFEQEAPADIAWLLDEVERKDNVAKSLATELRWLRSEQRKLGGES